MPLSELKTPGVVDKDLTPCALCKEPLLVQKEGTHLTCMRIRVTRLIANVGAIREQQGMMQILGGHGELARALGTQRDFLVPIHEEETVLICETCLLDRPLYTLQEIKK